MKQTFVCLPGGEIEVIGEPVIVLGAGQQRRVTHILPVNPFKRAAFVLLRMVFGERSRVAEKTRRWRGPWRAEIIATGQTLVHPSRKVLLRWERRVLESMQ